MMKAFVIAAETPKDESTFSEYRKAVPATLKAFGGKFIARGGNLKLLEGEWPHPRLVIIEFPSRDAAEGWYRSPDLGAPRIARVEPVLLKLWRGARKGPVSRTTMVRTARLPPVTPTANVRRANVSLANAGRLGIWTEKAWVSGDVTAASEAVYRMATKLDPAA
jgi:uncharacterized protein (DUF1330 family)